MSNQPFSEGALAFFASRAIRPEIAAEVGVREEGDDLIFPGERRRSLNGTGAAKVRQPKGKSLTAWWPNGRPEPGAAGIVFEGETDGLAGVSWLPMAPGQARLDDIAPVVIPGTGYNAKRLAAELDEVGMSEAFLPLDGDEAGRRYAKRAAEELRKVGIQPIPVELPEGKDLAEVLVAADDPGAHLANLLADARAAMETNSDDGAAQPAEGISEKVPDAAELVKEIARLLRRFVVMSPAQRVVVALWVLHTHVIEAADTTPYLGITSAEKRCGKSRLLEVLAQLIPNPVNAANISEAALFRVTSGAYADGRATLLIDETDAIFKGGRDKDDLRGLINAGYRRGMPAWRCVGDGSRQRVESFEVFAAKALAGIRELPETIADRSIQIRLERRTRDEHVERGRYLLIAIPAKPIKSACGAWAETALESLRESRPDLPEELDDRMQDGVEPLLAIADLIGGDWPTTARAAVVELCAGKPDEDPSWGVQLLADIRRAFGDDDRLGTEELIDRLKADSEAPWGTWGHDGTGLNPRRLATLLKPYGIKSKTVRLDDDTTLKGYKREEFNNAFARYLSSSGAPSVTGVTTALESQKQPLANPSQQSLVTDADEPENRMGKPL
jgi:hypothetical protein